MNYAKNLITKSILILSIVFLYACQEEDLLTDEGLQIEEVEAITTCDIIGPTSGAPNQTLNFFYSSNFTPSNVIWTVLSGNIVSNGGGSFTLLSNFTGGTIRVIGSGSQICSDTQNISLVNPPCIPPNFLDIKQVSGACMGDIFTFEDRNKSTNSGTYSWSVFQGAQIVSGQGTDRIRVQSPSSGGFSISLTHVSNCQNTQLNAFTLAEFDAGCSGGGGFGGPF